MKDLDYFILEEITKDEFEELTKKYGATKHKGMPTDLWFDWVEYRNKHREETDKYLVPIVKKEVETLNAREKKLWINLPYTVDIYNKGQKNKDFIFGIRTMLNIVHRARHWETVLNDDGDYNDTCEYYFNGTFKCQLPPDAIHFEGVDDNATDNFKKNPKIISDVYIDTIYFSKRGERPTWDDICKGWRYYFEKVFNQFKGKVTFIIDVDPTNKDYLTLKFADEKIQKEIDEKIKYMNDPERVKELEIDWNKKWDDYYKKERKKAYDNAVVNSYYGNEKENRINSMKELEAELIKNGTSQREIDKQVADLLNKFYFADERKREFKPVSPW